jgi:hypothetical protein
VCCLIGMGLMDGQQNTPTPRGEGAGLSAPAAAAKQEQLAQHCHPLYQPGDRGVQRGRHGLASREPKGAGAACTDER